MNKSSKQNKRTTKAKLIKKVAVKADGIQKTENHPCHVHDEIKDWDNIDEIRESICRDLETIEHSDGKHYCLLHLPTKDNKIKNKKFDSIIQVRLQEIKDKIAKIKAEFPEDEDKQNEEIEKLSYDFRYVWFPQYVSFNGHKFTGSANFSSAKFTGTADFSSATFTGYAYFRLATFTGDANFSSATFTGDAYFSSATFTRYANFRLATFTRSANFSSATFTGNANFISAKFTESADFSLATFTRSAYFKSATFTGNANFISATFTESAYFRSVTFTGNAYLRSVTFTGHASFSSTTFKGFAHFSSATFNGSVDFSSATFEEKSQIIFDQTKFSNVLNLSDAKIKGYVKFEGTNENRLFIEQHSFLDLQNAQIDDAKKISFHIVRLEPSWFVNTDAKEFVFTDCKWRNFHGKHVEVKSQLQNLEDRGEFENPNALLTKACWQLAENHENVKEFALASDFREIAQESKRLQDDWYKQPFTLRWWYWLASKYGESSKQAALMFAGIIVVFALFYNSPWASFEPMPNKSEVYKMNKSEGIVHSLGVATFQRPEPKPADSLTKFAITLETILAPLQAALLALAIRRKFMR